MAIEEDFTLAAEEATKLPENVSNADKLKLYGLYKQATVGDVNTDRPGIFDQKGRAKWDAWSALKGQFSLEEAKRAYIALVEELKAKYL